jgi:hypothetical protein
MAEGFNSWRYSRNPSLLALHTTAGVDKLPLQEMDDQSLIFPTVAERQQLR